MSATNKIAILLSAYNGEKYLPQQLDSLLNQDEGDIAIYIRDDGSTDGTNGIINRYVDAHRDRIMRFTDEKQHRGAAASFMTMLEHIESDYYMFCDQDDVWLPSKVSDTFALMAEKEKRHGGPVVVYTDLEVVDEHLSTIRPSLIHANGNDKLIGKDYAWKITNTVTGCTMMLNKPARALSLPYPDYALMHDYWVNIRLMSHGGHVVFLDKPTIRYRQHASNVLGAHIVTFRDKIGSLTSMLKCNADIYHFVHRAARVSFMDYAYCKLRYYLFV